MSPRDYAQRRTGVKHYLAFCKKKNIEPLPANGRTQSLYILAWITDPSLRNKAFATLRNYAHQVRWFIARIRGVDTVSTTDWDAVLRSLSHQAPPTNRARDAFDLDLLKAHMKYKDPVLPFATLLAALFILRPSEYCAAIKPHHKPLQWSDVTLVRDKLYIRLSWSKTNANGEITTLCREASPGHRLCVVDAYKRYIATVPVHLRTGTFLKRPDGADLDRRSLTKYVKHVVEQAGRPTDKISLYSLRKAGATRMWLATKDVMLTMREGRWKSMQAMQLYLRLDPAAGGSKTAAVTRAHTHTSSSLLVATKYKYK